MGEANALGGGSVQCRGAAEAKAFWRVEQRYDEKARLERVLVIQAQLFGFCP